MEGEGFPLWEKLSPVMDAPSRPSRGSLPPPPETHTEAVFMGQTQPEILLPGTRMPTGRGFFTRDALSSF